MTSRDFDCPTLSPTEDLWVGMQLPRHKIPKLSSAFRNFVCTIGDEILTQEIISNMTSIKMSTPFNCPSRINSLIKSLPFPPNDAPGKGSDFRQASKTLRSRFLNSDPSHSASKRKIAASPSRLVVPSPTAPQVARGFQSRPRCLDHAPPPRLFILPKAGHCHLPTHPHHHSLFLRFLQPGGLAAHQRPAPSEPEPGVRAP